MVYLLFLSILLTSFVSGILGMAGGMILIGVLTLILPISTAMILHGVTQMASNGFRAFLLREHIQWKILPTYLAGALASWALFMFVQFVPSKSLVLIFVGVFPILALILPKSLALDIQKKSASLLCGFLITSTQILAGASGPLLDVFYIKSKLDRHKIIATKALTQTVGHFFKLLYYSRILYLSEFENLEIIPPLFPLAILTAFTGTRAGKIVLDKITEIQFQKYSRFVISLIAGFYILKGILFSIS